jgi:hypothetical protein
LRPYNGFDGAQRLRALAWAKIGYADGTRERAKLCMACGQTQGILDRHSEDYSEPFGDHIGAFHLCFTCHMQIHCRFARPAVWRRYRDAVNAGATFRPIYSRDFRLFTSLYSEDSFPEPWRMGPPPARRVLDEVRDGPNGAEAQADSAS